MEMHYIWWIVAAALAVVEMTTGSLYLLVLALAAAAAGVLAWFGFDLSSQWACAVAMGVIGLFANGEPLPMVIGMTTGALIGVALTWITLGGQRANRLQSAAE